MHFPICHISSICCECMPPKTNSLNLDVDAKPILNLKPVLVLTKEVTKCIVTIPKNTTYHVCNMYTLKYLMYSKIVLKH